MSITWGRGCTFPRAFSRKIFIYFFPLRIIWERWEIFDQFQSHFFVPVIMNPVWFYITCKPWYNSKCEQKQNYFKMFRKCILSKRCCYQIRKLSVKTIIKKLISPSDATIRVIVIINSWNKHGDSFWWSNFSLKYALSRTLKAFWVKMSSNMVNVLH